LILERSKVDDAELIHRKFDQQRTARQHPVDVLPQDIDADHSRIKTDVFGETRSDASAGCGRM